MPTFYLLITDGVQKEVELELSNAHEAVNSGLNALAQFAFRHFPPPESISIHISDDKREHVATLNLSFQIQYGKGITV